MNCGRCAKPLDRLDVRVGDPFAPTPICKACGRSLRRAVKRAEPRGALAFNMGRWLAGKGQILAGGRVQ